MNMNMNNNVKTDISEDFSYEIYCKFNNDLVNLTEEDAILHFKQYGHL
jgi:hypothetical protein